MGTYTKTSAELAAQVNEELKRNNTAMYLNDDTERKKVLFTPTSTNPQKLNIRLLLNKHNQCPLTGTNILDLLDKARARVTTNREAKRAERNANITSKYYEVIANGDTGGGTETITGLTSDTAFTNAYCTYKEAIAKKGISEQEKQAAYTLFSKTVTAIYKESYEFKNEQIANIEGRLSLWDTLQHTSIEGKYAQELTSSIYQLYAHRIDAQYSIRQHDWQES